MNKAFNELFPGGGGGVLAPSLATNFFTSRTWVAPQDGIVVVRAMGAGGGGAQGGNATGGYSASWGAKALRVSKGTAVAVAIGAGGVGRSGSSGNGNAGGNTTVTINGVTYIAYGGPGGVYNAAAVLPNGPSPSANWDFGVDSVRPWWQAGTCYSGGAGVDILAQGNNATTSSFSPGATGGGGGGTGSAAVADSTTPGGAAPGGYSADGRPPANPPIYLDASDGEWGISFFGGSGGSGSGNGGNGGGGQGGSNVGSGGNGGGGGSSSPAAGNGGIGGGGGGSGVGSGGKGGNGFAHLKFFADMRL